MKRIICIILTIVTLISIFPAAAFAESSEEQFLSVVKANAPIRAENKEEGKVLCRCEDGALLKYLDTAINTRLRKWYKVSYNDTTGYIYSGNVELHYHSYVNVTVDGITYKICSCGSASVLSIEKGYPDNSNEVLQGFAAVVPLLPFIDGLAPFGDIISATIAVIGGAVAVGIAVPVTSDIISIISESDFDDYLSKRDEHTCSQWSFRRVTRVGGKLMYLDNRCMDAVEAYLWVVLINGDVYTPSEGAAIMLAAMYGSAICERDKDETTYFYHYHFGVDRLLKGHIFFGVNDLGEMPMNIA